VFINAEKDFSQPAQRARVWSVNPHDRAGG
jgi:hypothetical protein